MTSSDPQFDTATSHEHFVYQNFSRPKSHLLQNQRQAPIFGMTRDDTQFDSDDLQLQR